MFQESQITILDKNLDTPLISFVKEAYQNALIDKGKIDKDVLLVRGASEYKYRYFINNLIELLPDARYLEIGVLSIYIHFV